MNVCQASEIRLLPGMTGKEILSESKHVLETNGEWELSDIKVVPSELELDVGSYSVVQVQVGLVFTIIRFFFL